MAGRVVTKCISLCSNYQWFFFSNVKYKSLHRTSNYFDRLRVCSNRKNDVRDSKRLYTCLPGYRTNGVWRGSRFDNAHKKKPLVINGGVEIVIRLATAQVRDDGNANYRKLFCRWDYLKKNKQRRQKLQPNRKLLHEIVFRKCPAVNDCVFAFYNNIIY